MSRAKQQRRIARTWARALGTACGTEDVDIFANEELIRVEERFVTQGIDYEEPDLQLGLKKALRATIAPGQTDWDEGAAQADVAGMVGCPQGYELEFYAAYGQAAYDRVVTKVQEITQSLKGPQK